MHGQRDRIRTRLVRARAHGYGGHANDSSSNEETHDPLEMTNQIVDILEIISPLCRLL